MVIVASGGICGGDLTKVRETCTILGKFDLEGMAIACRAEYFDISRNKDIGEVIPKALAISSKGKPVIVDVNIDYSKWGGTPTLLHGKSFSHVSDIISKVCFFCTFLQGINKTYPFHSRGCKNCVKTFSFS